MGKLRDILQSMIDETQIVERATRRLPNGLQITMQASTDYYIIILAREDVYPSDKEWETVFKHFPYYTPIPEAAQIAKGQRRALRGKIAKRHMQQIRFA